MESENLESNEKAEKIQIKSGNCDKLFFLDPNEYFGKIQQRTYRRDLAIKFVTDVFSKSRIKLKENIVDYSEPLSNFFSPCEIISLLVFKTKIQDYAYFDINDDNSHPKKKL